MDERPLIVFSALIGGPPEICDQIRPVIAPRDPKGRRTKFIFFIDRRTSGPYLGWDCRFPAWTHDFDDRRTARRIKTNPEALFRPTELNLTTPPAVYTLWCDASHQLKVNPWELIDALPPGTNLATFRHPDRADVWAEGQACVALKKDNEQLIRAQLERYIDQGYSPVYPLAETSVIVRRHTTVVQKFDALWWKEIVDGSRRDQLSFNYALDKAGLIPGWLDGQRTESPYFNFFPHR
jgi:hypothetical protein